MSILCPPENPAWDEWPEATGLEFPITTVTGECAKMWGRSLQVTLGGHSVDHPLWLANIQDPSLTGPVGQVGAPSPDKGGATPLQRCRTVTQEEPKDATVFELFDTYVLSDSNHSQHSK